MEAPLLPCLIKLFFLVGGITVVYLGTARMAAILFGRTQRWGKRHLAEVTECSDEEIRQRYGKDADKAVILIVAGRS